MIPEDCWYDNINRELMGSRANKITKFLKEKKVEYIDEMVFKVHPCIGRNTIQTVDLENESCSCQAYVMHKIECSHIIVCKLFLNQVNDGGRDLNEGK